MLNILYIITRSDTIGGAHVHVLDLASRAMAEGNQVAILVGGNGPYATVLRESGLRVINMRYLIRPIRPHIDVLAVIECWWKFRKIKPDIVHAHSSKAGIIGRLGAKMASLPVVFTAHGWAFTEGIAERSRRLAVFLEKLCARWSDAIICVSDYDRQLALRMGVGNSSLITRIHNGVPEAGVHHVRNIEEIEECRFISVARFDAPKDHSLLLDALAMIKDRKWSLELIGDGPLTDVIKLKAQELGLADRIRFSGLCNDVPTRLAAADVFVLTSGWEGLPLSILEAMRAGLPVVASDVGGVSESVANEVTGFLVEKGDKFALSNKLMHLLEDPDLRKEMGRAGRAAYEQEFSFEMMYRRTTKVYEDVLSRRALR